MAEDKTINQNEIDNPLGGFDSNDNSFDSFFNNDNEDTSSILDTIMSTEISEEEGEKEDEQKENKEKEDEEKEDENHEDHENEAEQIDPIVDQDSPVADKDNDDLGSSFDNTLDSDSFDPNDPFSAITEDSKDETYTSSDDISSFLGDDSIEATGLAGLDDDPFGSSLFDSHPQATAGIDDDNPFADLITNPSPTNNGDPFADNGDPFANNDNPFTAPDDSSTNNDNPFANMIDTSAGNKVLEHTKKSGSPFDDVGNDNGPESPFGSSEPEGNDNISIDDFLKSLP